jgi:hypothetical protein
MKIPSDDRAALLHAMPKIKLSYEINIHNKETTNVDNSSSIGYFIIPKGRRYVAWFTTYKCDRVCIFIEVIRPIKNVLKGMPSQQQQQQQQDHVNSFGDMYVFPVCFDAALSLGTIISGTMFNTQQSGLRYFTVQNMYAYKGNIVHDKYSHMHDYMKLITRIFDSREIVQTGFTSNGVVFGLPICCQTMSQAETIALSGKLPYTVYSIHKRYQGTAKVEQFVLGNGNVSVPVVEIPRIQHTPPSPAQHQKQQQQQQPPRSKYTQHETSYGCFLVRPDIQFDIYDLYICDNTTSPTLKKHNVAHIPSYKTSVLMNTLFRNIKENTNLDFLEESDDEDEFENTDVDKYVDMTKEICMICIFNDKFRRWIPVEVAQNIDPKNCLNSISTLSYIQSVENNNYKHPYVQKQPFQQKPQSHHHRKHVNPMNIKKSYSNYYFDSTTNRMMPYTSGRSGNMANNQAVHQDAT